MKLREHRPIDYVKKRLNDYQSCVIVLRVDGL
jgi:hypothetical protein